MWLPARRKAPPAPPTALAAITTTAPGDYLFTLWGQNYKSTSMAENGTGFTILNKNTAGTAHAMRLQSAAGAAQEKVSTGSSVYMTSIVAAFKAASTGGSAVYTAPASGGVHTIAATSDAGTGSATVTVQSATQQDPVTVAVTPSSATVLEGGTVSLAATVSNSTNTFRDLERGRRHGRQLAPWARSPVPAAARSTPRRSPPAPTP